MSQCQVFLFQPGHILSLETELRIIYPGSEDFLKIQFPCYDIYRSRTFLFSPVSRLRWNPFSLFLFLSLFLSRVRSLMYNYRKYFVVLNYVDCLDTSLDYILLDIRPGIIFYHFYVIYPV